VQSSEEEYRSLEMAYSLQLEKVRLVEGQGVNRVRIKDFDAGVGDG